MLNYDGWCRRIDLMLRARFPYLATRLFRIKECDYSLLVVNEVDDFGEIKRVFDKEVRYATAPIKIVNEAPECYEQELMPIADESIPSNFEGMPFTLNQMLIHVASIHPDVTFSAIREDHDNKKIIIEIDDESSIENIDRVQATADGVKAPYEFQVVAGGESSQQISVSNEVFGIVPSQSRKMLNCDFLERDEALWYGNLDEIYSGGFKKSDLYFYDQKKSSCLVNYSRFKNANLRNHLLLYDVVYCVLPLLEDMEDFLRDQKVSRDDLLGLIKRGRIKILNVQPESRLDFGFLNEAYSESPESVISRRAISVLSAIDLVELNQTYIFSDPEMDKYILPLIAELVKLSGLSFEVLSNLLLWPKQALRKSLDSLNHSGPMGIAQYGVNQPIISFLPSETKKRYELEFLVNSDQIHLAHALDATYFPFYTDDNKYSDHPYAMMMGSLLNLYRKSGFQASNQFLGMGDVNKRENDTLSLITTFDINDYIPLPEFEAEISSGVVRKEMRSLFTELSALRPNDRNDRISQYNAAVDRKLNNKNISKHALDLGEDVLGMFVPFLGTGRKIITNGARKAMGKYPVVQEVSEFIEDKTLRGDAAERHVSLLTRINRVARLKRKYG